MANNSTIIIAGISSAPSLFNIACFMKIVQNSLVFHITIFLLVIPLFSLLKLTFLVVKKKEKHPLPPGPTPWPVLGCIPHMAIKRSAFRWIHKVIDQMNTEIACIRLGSVNVIAVISPEIGQEFLKKQDAIFASRPVIMSADIASRGFLTTALAPWGEHWKKMRIVMASELFSLAKHRWLHCKRVEEADHLMRYIYNQCKSDGCGLANIRVTTQQYCANLIRKLLFNKRFFGKGMEDGGPGFEEEEHTKALFTILAHLYSFCVSDYLPFLRWRFDVDGHEKVMKWTDEIMRKYQDPLVDERIRQWEKGSKKEVEDLLDVLVSSKDERGNPLLISEEIKAQITEIMIAAVDNPSNAAEWALAEMINKPAMLEKAIEELDNVVGKGRLVQESDFPKLNYVKACAREAFRLHPVAPFNLPHVATKDTVVAGYFIPKGSHVLLSRPGLGRNPRVWDDPYTFKPERHLIKGVEVLLTEPNLRFISFSTGRRGCMGVALGTSMTVMLLARLLHGFTWAKPPNVPNIDLSECENSLFLAKPLVAAATPRLPAHIYPT